MTKLDFPDTPSTGQQFGSAGTVWRWDGTRWASTAGAAGARGALGYAQILANQGGIVGASTPIGGLSVPVTLTAGRRYRVSTQMYCKSTVAGDTAAIYITDGVGNTLNSAYGWWANANTSATISCDAIFTATSTGAVTYKVNIARVGGTGTFTVEAGAGFPAFILVEDITYEAGTAGPQAQMAYGSYGVSSVGYADASGIKVISHSLGVVPTRITITPSLGFNKRSTTAKITYQVYDVSSTYVRIQHSDGTIGNTCTDVNQEVAYYWCFEP